jgi:hypothetical protein
MVSESVISDRDILEAALVGFEHQRDRIDEGIREIQSQLGVRRSTRPAVSSNGVNPAPEKRRMSAAARRRIGEATRRRWMLFRQRKANDEKPAEQPKRKMSAAGRKAIVEATKKRWAEFHKAQKAAAKKTSQRAA